MKITILLVHIYAYITPSLNQRTLGNFEEVFAWKQMTYNINGNLVKENLASDVSLNARFIWSRRRRNEDAVHFADDGLSTKKWNQRYPSSNFYKPSEQLTPNFNNPVTTSAPPITDVPEDESSSFFIQYNNLPMGVERVGETLFVAQPRRRYGIPATLNFIDLSQDWDKRSPALKPYPDLQRSKLLTSVYRTRADECNRLWMVDTGLMEIPDNPQQVQQPAIVIFDLDTNKQILRHELKSSDIPAANTPTGLASITVDTSKGCDNAFAYLPDLTTFGLIVFSYKDKDTWRLENSYFHFNPNAVNLNIAGHQFQWSDGIFSVTLSETDPDGCRTAYFHPLISTTEYSVSTCILNNRTASNDSNIWREYSILGERGANSQCTMHAYDPNTKVIFFADIGRNAVSCWNTRNPLTPDNVAVLASDEVLMSYPADLHVTENEVWVIANTLPRFGYSRLNVEDYNYYVYRGKVDELIAGTVCS